MRFYFDPLSTTFSDQRVFDENAQRSMDERPKRIEMYAFSNELTPKCSQGLVRINRNSALVSDICLDQKGNQLT